MHIAIVGAEVKEIIALGIVLTIREVGIRPQFSIQMSPHDIQRRMKTMILISYTSSKGGVLQVILLPHLRFCAMIARGDYGRHCSVSLKSSVLITVREKGCSRKALGDCDGSTYPIKIISSRTRGMSSEGGSRASKILK
jgi:hypothetical protein